jgi:DNA-binding beta-propeller fold protein YncE
VTTLAGKVGGAYGVAVDNAGNVFVADHHHHTVRMVTPAGVVTTIGGVAGVMDGADGVGSSARFAAPSGIAVDKAGNLYVADEMNNRITKGTPVYP